MEWYLAREDKPFALLDPIPIPQLPYTGLLRGGIPDIPQTRFLLRNYADVNARIEAPIEAGIGLDALTQEGLTAMRIAMQRNKRDELRALVQSGATVHPFDTQNHDRLWNLSAQHLESLARRNEFVARQLGFNFDGLFYSDWMKILKCTNWHRLSECQRLKCSASRNRMGTEHADAFVHCYQDLCQCLGIPPKTENERASRVGLRGRPCQGDMVKIQRTGPSSRVVYKIGGCKKPHDPSKPRAQFPTYLRYSVLRVARRNVTFSPQHWLTSEV